MTEDQKQKMQAQAREFPETLGLIVRVRDALASKLFETPLNARDAREELYLRVQTLDAMKVEIDRLLKAGTDEVLISEYAAQVASGKAAKD